jgi:hypothetical protein
MCKSTTFLDEEEVRVTEPFKTAFQTEERS